MPMTIEQVRVDYVREELNTHLPNYKTADQIAILVNGVLGLLFRSINSDEHNQLYRQLSLILHPSSMDEPWKQHLQQNKIDIGFLFKQLDSYLPTSSRIQVAMRNETVLENLLWEWFSKSFENLKRYSLPLKFLAYLVQGLAMVVSILTAFIGSGVLYLAGKVKDFFVNGFINIMTADGLNKAIDNFVINYPEEYKRYSDEVLMFMKNEEIRIKEHEIIKLEKKVRGGKANVNLNGKNFDDLRNALEKLRLLDLDGYEALVKSNEDNVSNYESMLKDKIKDSGINYIAHVSHAIWNSVTSPLPDSWLLKPFALFLRSFELVLGAFAAMPIAIANWMVNKIIALTIAIFVSTLAIAYAAVALPLNLPFIVKDSCCGDEDEKSKQQPEVNPNRWFRREPEPAEQQQLGLKNAPGASAA